MRNPILAAVEAAAAAPGRRAKIRGATVLTSLDDADLARALLAELA